MHILNTAVSSKVHGTIMLTQQVEGIFIINCISHSVCQTHCIARQIVLNDELKLKASILSGALRSSLITPMRSDHLIKVKPNNHERFTGLEKLAGAIEKKGTVGLLFHTN